VTIDSDRGEAAGLDRPRLAVHVLIGPDLDAAGIDLDLLAIELASAENYRALFHIERMFDFRKKSPSQQQRGSLCHTVGTLRRYVQWHVPKTNGSGTRGGSSAHKAFRVP
jgi:hypothetical protein